MSTHKPEPGAVATSSRLLIGNLPLEASESSICDFLNKFGKVRHVEIPLNQKSGKPLGFAQVEMESAEQARLVLCKVAGTEWQNRKLSVEVLPPKSGVGIFSGLFRLLTNN